MNKSAKTLRSILAIITCVLSLAVIVVFFVLVDGATGLAFGILIGGAIAIVLQYLLLDALCQALIDIAETRADTAKMLAIASKNLTANPETKPAAKPTSSTITKAQDSKPAQSTDTAQAHTPDMDTLDNMMSNGQIDQETYKNYMHKLINLNNLLSTRFISQEVYDRRVRELFATITE